MKTILKNRIMILGLLFCLICVATEAQTELPTIVHPSPQSRNFQKYGDYPVSHSTGIPDISIPLHTIQAGDLQVPIVLRYHASGIKPKDPDLSNIGAGWTLDVGGLISRTVKGKADEMYRRTYFQTEHEIDQSNVEDLGELSGIVSARVKDAEHDFFNYSFLGHSGKFVIKDDGTGNFKAYPIPFVPYRFHIQTAAPTCPWGCYKSFAGMDITDDNGVQYKFGYLNQEVASGDGEYAPTGWFLEEIKNASNTNQIFFEYATIPEFSHSTYNSSVTVTDDWKTLGVLCPTEGAPVELYPSSTQENSPSAITYRTKNLQIIRFTGGRIEFILSTSKRHIESIEVYNANNQVIKSFVFNRTLFATSSNFYKLNSLEIRDRSGQTVERYGFSYYETQLFTDYNSTVDFWGYCNGTSDTPPCCRTHYRNIDVEGPIPNSILAIGNSDFSAGASTRYMLKRIKYPTGGTTEFTYESNVYRDWTNPAKNHIGGGLRIKKIESRDNAGKTTIKSYEYEPGQIDFPLDNEAYYAKTWYHVVVQCTSGDGRLPFHYIGRNRLYDNGWNGNMGDNKTSYARVTEYTGTNTSNVGKTVYTYEYKNPDVTGILKNGSGFIAEYRDWGNGLLKEQEMYKLVGSNIFTKVKHIINNYEHIDIDTLTNLYAYMWCYYPGSGGSDPLGIYYLRRDLTTVAPNIYYAPDPCYIDNYYIVTGAYYLKSTEERDYSKNDVATVRTDYKHDNPDHFYRTEITNTLSDGQKITRLKYPQDVNDAISEVMISKNILAPVIEQSTFKNETFLQSVKTNYREWPSNIVAPETVEVKAQTNPSEVRLRFHDYDSKGNVTCVSKESGMKIAYLYGYQATLPIIHAVNTTQDELDAKTNLVLTQLGYTTGLQELDAFLSEIGNLDTDSKKTKWILFNQTLRESFAGSSVTMTTYSFDPPTGMTSVVDANNMVTYYEYDNFGRLQSVKDFNKDIINNYQYYLRSQQN